MIIKKSYRIILYATAIFLLLSPYHRIYSVYSSEPADESKGKWVLYKTFVGEGGEINCSEGSRCEGSYDKWTAGRTSLTYHSRRFDHWGTEDFTDARFKFTLPEFPEKLTPGEKDVELMTTGTASGYMKAEYFVASLEIWGDIIALRGFISTGEEVKGTYGPRMTIDVDYEEWNGEEWVITETEIPASDTLTIKFDVPEGSEGEELGITAVMVGSMDASVEWVYRFEAPEVEEPH
jgi:hypothetical protein